MPRYVDLGLWALGVSEQSNANYVKKSWADKMTGGGGSGSGTGFGFA